LPTLHGYFQVSGDGKITSMSAFAAAGRDDDLLNPAPQEFEGFCSAACPAEA
jgi:hypothetical protein